MIVLVCGGRDYQDRERVFCELDRIESQGRPIIGLIHGAARGADKLAKEWQDARIKRVRAACKRCPLWCCGYPADWDRFGKAAGRLRNQLMLDANPGIQLVVSFPGGVGTADMVERAIKKGIEVISIT